MKYSKKIIALIFFLFGLTNNALAMIQCPLGTSCIIPYYGVFIGVPITQKGNYRCQLTQKKDTGDAGVRNTIIASSYESEGEWRDRQKIEIGERSAYEGSFYFTPDMIEKGFLMLEVEPRRINSDESDLEWVRIKIAEITMHCVKL